MEPRYDRAGEAGLAGREEAGYAPHEGQQLYWVRHHPPLARRGRVLLAGPLGDERMHGYLTWVRWARALAGAGFEVLRFDYRGQGESTGRFEEMSLTAWSADLARALGLLTEEADSGPVVLMGLRVGGLLAARAFAEGAGDALLLWGPPASGRAMLGELLRRKLAEAFMEGRREKGRDRDWYIRELLSGRTVEVNGYPWSEGLWRDAEGWPLALPGPGERRPWAVVRLDASTPALEGDHVWKERLPRPPFWAMNQNLVQDVGGLFASSLAWMERAAAGGAP